MGTRETDQPPLWIATSDLPTSPGHPFYARLTTLLDGHHFDRFVEGLCDRFYAPVMGRPSLAPGRYFRLLLVGYFEGIDSERGIAWRATDSLAVRSFLRLAVDEAPPDHSTIARTRRLIDLETHRPVFTWVQQRLVEAGRLKGKTIAIDATTLEANAAMRSIVRRDTGESYQAFLAGLAKASGIETPTREGLARLDRKRKKKTSNKDWTNPHDPDAKVTKMKDGRTHLAHKAEHAVDMETGAIVAVTLQGADVGDTTTIIETAIAAAEQAGFEICSGRSNLSDNARMTVTDPRTLRYLELEDSYAAHNYQSLDVVIERAAGVWVWDVEGHKYLDCLASYGALNQGHNHPRIVRALVEQAQTLALTSRAFRNDRFGPFCERLARLSSYEKVLMMNTGAEAVETAVKAARRWGYREKGITEDAAEIIVFDGNFHGRTTTIVSFSSDPGARFGYGPYTPGFTAVRFGDLDEVRHAMTRETCAVLVEPIQGEGGVIVPPDGFLPGLRQLCDDEHVLLICDEIQSGLGRTGHFFAHTREGVRADAVVIGKALSGGLYPVSAFLADDTVMDVFDPGSHGSTYGGNPLACAVAEAALDVLLDENLIERAGQLGEYLGERLHRIRSELVKEIRCVGLWAGVELYPEAGGARRFSEALRGEGVLVKETHEHTLRLAPPLVITKEELELACEKLDRVLTGSA